MWVGGTIFFILFHSVRALGVESNGDLRGLRVAIEGIWGSLDEGTGVEGLAGGKERRGRTTGRAANEGEGLGGR